MANFKRVAVIGAGVMGAGIAAHLANAGVQVLLLDIVPNDAADRNQIAKDAIAKLLKTNPAPLMHKRFAKNITPGNIADDLPQVKECDWVIEAIIERLDIKQDLYHKIAQSRGKDTARHARVVVCTAASGGGSGSDTVALTGLVAAPLRSRMTSPNRVRSRSRSRPRRT